MADNESKDEEAIKEIKQVTIKEKTKNPKRVAWGKELGSRKRIKKSDSFFQDNLIYAPIVIAGIIAVGYIVLILIPRDNVPKRISYEEKSNEPKSKKDLNLDI